ncbi:hypothetical protein CBI38_28565 [Rhodococcus oxybenzonivorans]|uniref:Uncharacterized protein n=1 Tax=Rhodococcus oxybenzonivorans TaxID=1990687 RepID=A0A2S2C213_9NOCA|nr:hypothetical protein CBI38_28565 [Rhodococcus oxybenzonivorans]
MNVANDVCRMLSSGQSTRVSRTPGLGGEPVTPLTETQIDSRPVDTDAQTQQNSSRLTGRVCRD